jgi:hypothetical protein
MNFGDLIVLLPLWGLFLFTLAICLASVEAGAAAARIVLRRQPEKEPEGPLGSLVGSLLGLLAFFLAFTFGMTAARFDMRKQLVLDEANAIGTTYLRAGLLPGKQGLEVRRLLRTYADLRLGITSQNFDAVRKQSGEIQTRLWATAESLVSEEMDSQIRSLFIASLNDLIDLHQSRITVGTQYRIPGMIWLTVYILSAISMLAFGYQVGMAGIRRLRGTPVLAVAFSLVITMIADIDRPGEGFLRIDHQPIADTLQMMQADDSPKPPGE